MSFEQGDARSYRTYAAGRRSIRSELDEKAFPKRRGRCLTTPRPDCPSLWPGFADARQLVTGVLVHTRAW